MTTELVLDKIRAASALSCAVTLSADETSALADWLRRAAQEISTPYQCYWRDRAQRAEAMLAGHSQSTKE